MKKYLLILFLSLPFLFTGPLESAFNMNAPGDPHGEKIFSSFSPQDKVTEAAEFLAEEGEEREEEESLHQNPLLHKITFFSHSPERVSCTIPTDNAARLQRHLIHTLPFNKAPPL